MNMSDEDWEELDTIPLYTIWLCLGDDALFNIFGEEKTRSLLRKMESLHD